MAIGKILLYIYAAILLSGAYFGGRAKSRISVIMGIGSSLIIILAIFLTEFNGFIGLCLLTALSALLSIVFLIRFIKTSKFMPAGMLLGVNLLYLLYFVFLFTKM